MAKSKSTAGTAYSGRLSVPEIDGSKYTVFVTVMRKSGRELTEDELALFERVLPVGRKLPEAVAVAAKKPRTKKPATKTTTKRKAAKKP